MILLCLSRCKNQHPIKSAQRYKKKSILTNTKCKMQIFLLKMFEKCGFSNENTRELLSPIDAHGLAPIRGKYYNSCKAPHSPTRLIGDPAARNNTASAQGNIYFNNTNTEESTITTSPAVGVCCSPTELLLNKVVCVVVNQILLKLFTKQTPWFSEVPCGSVVKTKTTERCLSAGDDTNHRRHRFARNLGISVYISVISGN